MTCIAAIAQNGIVYMAADSAASDEKSGWIVTRKDPKVFKVGQYGIAFTDSFRMGQILQYNWTPPKYTPTKTNSGLTKFMQTKFVDSVKDAFRANGFGSVAVPGSEDEGGIFIIGVEGRIFVMEDDFHIGENTINYMAEGSGGAFALGSLHTTKKQKNPKIRLKAALEAASEFTMSVSPPFTYLQV
jgi:ATP-dependent protease HslVU (ClpYQ) peptidase subunit